MAKPYHYHPAHEPIATATAISISASASTSTAYYTPELPTLNLLGTELQPVPS
jgi:hypothetical protein